MDAADRLDSWKEIARYVHRNPGTCMTWVKRYGLPVYHIDDKSARSRVFAFRSEIDRWFRSKTTKTPSD